MPFEIHDWNEIADRFTQGTVLVGNGASIAVDRKFLYTSLLEEARRLGQFNPEIEMLFQSFDTFDFELVLRLVWHATKVNSSLGIPDPLTQRVYQDSRRALIETVREVHPLHFEVINRLPSMYRFLKQFSTVLSLNYDLLVYWTMTHGLNISDGHSFKDCFLNGQFDDDWTRFRALYAERSNTLVFYPHGNLALCRNLVETEYKISDAGTGLLDAILDRWNTEQYVPLFVSEGTAEQKLSSIQNSYYLSTVFREVIPSLHGSLTILGWGLGDQDVHLLQRLSKAQIRRVACSVHNRSQRYCAYADRAIRDHLGNIEIVFFHSETSGWAVPLDE